MMRASWKDVPAPAVPKSAPASGVSVIADRATIVPPTMTGTAAGVVGGFRIPVELPPRIHTLAHPVACDVCGEPTTDPTERCSPLCRAATRTPTVLVGKAPGEYFEREPVTVPKLKAAFPADGRWSRRGRQAPRNAAGTRLIPKTCPECDTPFQTANIDQVCCSRRCGALHQHRARKASA